MSDVQPISEESMLSYIREKESRGNHLAQNSKSTAFGLYQFLDSTWATVGCVKTSDPIEQERCAIKYMKERYGSIEGAYKAHKQKGWY